MDVIQKVKFSSLDLSEEFFESLKQDYSGFEDWFFRKSNEEAYVIFNGLGNVDGFLYLKEEDDADYSIEPNLNPGKRLKIGTFKINAHGTVLGHRFLGIILRRMVQNKIDFTYVTLFEKQEGLIKLFEKFGFSRWGVKDNGELVYFKDNTVHSDLYKDFPKINLNSSNKKYLLSIYPQYHTLLFPDSRLNTERNHVIEDLSFTNTTEKIYLTKISQVAEINTGDLIVIYRTKEEKMQAEYSSVATSICSVLEVKNISEFGNREEFMRYCTKGTIFTQDDLNYFWKSKRYPYIIKMLYNVPLNKRIIRKRLIEEIGIDRGVYWGCIDLTDNQIRDIIEIGEVSEGFIID